MQDWFKIRKINIIHHTKRTCRIKKNHMVKFIIKILSQEICLDLTKGKFKKATNMVLNSESFSSTVGNKTRCLLSHVFNTVLKIPAKEES